MSGGSRRGEVIDHLRGRSKLGWLLTASAITWICFNLATAMASFSPPDPRSALQLQAAATKANGKIAFTSDRNGFLDIYVMNSDGTNQRQSTFGSKNPADGSSLSYEVNPVWSPDGIKIAFIGNLDYRRFNLNVMNADGTRIIKLTDGIDVSYATWSPDGKRIAFSDSCGSIEGLCPINIYTVNVDGTGLTNLTLNPRGAQDLEPAWSPDGTKIAFIGI